MHHEEDRPMSPPVETTAQPGAAPRRRVLVTGAAGRIGSCFAQQEHQRYDLRLMVRGDEKRIEQIRSFGEVVTADLIDLERMKQVCRDMDAVLHLAANPNASATWDSILHANIIGTYNTFVAAKAAGCQRVVFASSIHAVSGYPADVQVKTNEPVNPGDIYGVSKCFGEALGRYMAEQEGLSTIAIRIGAYQPAKVARQESSVSLADAFLSERDLNQLMVLSLEAEGIRFAIVHGLSDNRFKRMDISTARELLGYRPQDNLMAENPQLNRTGIARQVPAHNLADGQKSGLRKDL
jgi:NAD(P)-dependent dehydrogenase (short-subunit alcohol dehydrogenase family)